MKNAIKKLSLIFWASMAFVNANAQFDLWIEKLVTDKDNVFVITSPGKLYLLTDSCKTWNEMSNGLGNNRITSMAISGSEMFVGTSESGVFVSHDKGKLWIPANSGLPKIPDGEKYFAITGLAAEGSKVAMIVDKGRFFVSNDNAVTWTEGKKSKDAYLQKLAISGGKIFAAVGYSDSYEPYLSTDDGMHWKKIGKGLEYTYIYALAASGTNVLAGGIGGMSSFLAENNKWTAVNTLNDEIRLIAVNGSAAVAGERYNSLHASFDAGKTWKDIYTSDLTGDNTALGITGTNIYTVIAGTLYYTTDDGKSWTSAKKGASEKVAEYVSSASSYERYYKEIGTQDGITLYADEYAGVIFKVKNNTASDIDVHMKLLFECKSTSFMLGESFQKFEVIWRISVPANSTRSYDDDPAACSVDGCKDHTESWKIVTWWVTAN
jgi:photosystem II stability/assembly factor-like uncharacterized protein